MSRIYIEHGSAPDGLYTMIGFQPPLDEAQQEVVETAMRDYLNESKLSHFLDVTGLIERVPDEGEAFSECQARPTQLHDGRAEAIGQRAIPGLVRSAADALSQNAKNDVSVNRSGPSLGATLFGGKMRVWYEEGRTPDPGPFLPIIRRSV